MKILWFGLEHELGVEEEHKVLIMNKSTFSIDAVMKFKPDIVIQREFNDGVELYEQELKQIKEIFPLIYFCFWFIDAHVAAQSKFQYCDFFDYVFVAHSPYLERVRKNTSAKYILWLPLCFPASILPEPLFKRDHTIGFIGRFNVPYLEERTKFLKTIQRKFVGSCYFRTNYQNVYGEMSNCEIMLNKSYSDDLNYRVFEALACDNILVTNTVPDLFKIKGLAQQCYVYKTTEGAIEMIDLIQRDPVEGSTRDYIKASHMLPHRVNSLLNMVMSKQQEEF